MAQLPLTEELYEAYRQTIYQVTLPHGPFELRVDTRHPRFDEAVRIHNARTWGFISAENPLSRKTEPDINEANHARLLQALAALGHLVFPAWGVPQGNDWTPEKSLCAFGIHADSLRTLGLQFGQNAVVWGETGHPARMLWCHAAPPEHPP